MMLTLAFRQLLVKRARSLFLLLGYALGVGVMIVLLSVGEAMLDQSRDVSLVGGGEVTILPEGIDVEALRTGGLSGMFFTVDRARYATRLAIGGPRHQDLVVGVAPSIENKLLYVASGSDTIAIRAGAEIPSRAARLGVGLRLLDGSWSDTPEDSAYTVPTLQQLYDELDHFHYPTVTDSTWGEWHYFNIVTGPDEWWYISLLVGGLVPQGHWGGQVLVTHRRPDGRYEKLERSVPSEAIRFDTARADVRVGESRVEQRDGIYDLAVNLPGQDLKIELELRPAPYHYFPPVQLREGEYTSGYAVAALRATATGRICRSGSCREVAGRAYHDHNWGVWRDVSWEWGAASGSRLSFLYGQVRAPDSGTAAEPFFVALVDSLGVLQVLRAQAIRYRGSIPLANGGAVTAPEQFEFLAARGADSVRIRVDVREAVGTLMGTSGFRRYFIQMRGAFRLSGRIGGAPVAESGDGFFETWRDPSSGPTASRGSAETR
jgi:hypothetical protein